MRAAGYARRAALAERLVELGDLSCAEAAAVIGSHESTVRRARREAGLPTRYGRRARRVRRGRSRRPCPRCVPKVPEPEVPEPEVPRPEVPEVEPEARAPLPVKRREAGRPSPEQVAAVQARIDAGERIARWSCSVCGSSVRWPTKPPGWWANPPAVKLKCPSCRPEGQVVDGDR